MSIDYGMGQTNLNKQTGTRYGVIPANDCHDCIYEDFEADYGPPTCGWCGNEFGDVEPEGGYYQCPCGKRSRDDDMPDEPIGYNLNDDDYDCELHSSSGDIFVLRSPYYTRADFCSPCAPGACYLLNYNEHGAKAYCLGHDFFEGEKAPYRMWRVDNDEEVMK